MTELLDEKEPAKGSAFRRLNDKVMGGCEAFCALLILLISTLTVLGVVMRYIFNYPLTWTDELSIIAFIYLTFMGIGVAFYQNRHLNVDAFIVVLSRRPRVFVMRIALGLMAIYLITVMVQMIRVIFVSSRVSSVTAALQLPMWVIYLSLVIGFVLFLVQVGLRFRNPEGRQ